VGNRANAGIRTLDQMVNQAHGQESHLPSAEHLLPQAVGLKDTVIFADQLMYTGFQYAALSGASIGIERHGDPGCEESTPDCAR
jgi:hypothetical protein